MTNERKPMSLFEALTAPMQQILQQMKEAAPAPGQHWTEYLRAERAGKT